uniref:DIRP domain-containing protein n=1 Tax=Anopheles merus TaxID=30066 RepID=A0A182UR70_ANOME
MNSISETVSCSSSTTNSSASTSSRCSSTTAHSSLKSASFARHVLRKDTDLISAIWQSLHEAYSLLSSSRFYKERREGTRMYATPVNAEHCRSHDLTSIPVNLSMFSSVSELSTIVGCSLDDCLEELEYEEVTCYEAEASSSTASKSYAVSNLVAEILERAEDDTKSSSEASSISCHNSPAKGAIFKSSKLAPHELQPKPASCHGNLKLHRFMMCEWFYSHIDSALFAEEHSRSVDFGTLLRQHYPALHRCPLQRPQWNRIRKEFGKVARVRRLSPAFLLQERITLERRREKVRFLMENPMIEYLDDDIPSIIPSRIEVGSKVRAALLSPNYGSFPGVVIGIENHDIPMFRVRFTIDGIDHEQLLPDYRVALDQSPPSPEQSDVLSVSAKHLRQVAALNECVDEKRRLLYELENIRLNVEARRAMGRINAERDQQQGQRYEQILRKLLDLNRTLLQLSKNVATEYEQNMSEQLTTSETPVVEAYVVEVVNQLIEDLSKLDQFHKNPEADRLWNEALERLGKNPEYLKQFGHYLASRIGNKFDPQAYRKQ